jgi:hypothetical protein
MRKISGFVAGVLIATFPQVWAADDSSQLERWKKVLSDNDEYLHALQVQDRNVLENAKVLIHNLRTKPTPDLAMAKYHSDEIGRSLHASDDYLTRLSKETDIAIDRIHLAYLVDLHAYYKRAIEIHGKLQEELIKASPTTSVVVMNALKIYAEMEKAGKEQIDLDLKADIKEPVAPAIRE